MQLSSADLVLELQAGDETIGGLFGFSVAISRQSTPSDYTGALLIGAPATNDDTLPALRASSPPPASRAACATR